MESGFKVENPNLKPIGSKPLEGPLAERVQQAIDQYVNPGVAQHGGHVTLVEVRDDIVYLQMGGGCQGCGMASVTLSQGIEGILKEQVPEIVADTCPPAEPGTSPTTCASGGRILHGSAGGPGSSWTRSPASRSRGKCGTRSRV